MSVRNNADASRLCVVGLRLSIEWFVKKTENMYVYSTTLATCKFLVKENIFANNIVIIDDEVDENSEFSR